MSNHSSFSSLASSYGSSVSMSPSSTSPLSSPERYACTSDDALRSATAMPAILENGRKVFGPPSGYVGPRPTYICELFVTHLPRDLDELHFLAWLHRCGVVYEFRLMMDTGVATRGYAFVRYTNERDALAAYELLNFVFICDERLSVYRSQGKNRLYISSIPKEIPLSALEAGFKKVFPDMQSCSLQAARSATNAKGELNRGYAFIEFNDHETALEAKKRTTPGRVRMWGCDLKVQWAKPKKLFNATTDLGDNEQPTTATRYSSDDLQLCPHNDYCAKLRLFCLANNWCIPVVVYGRCFRQHGVQYGGILLKNSCNGAVCCILMELVVQRDVSDIHELMCEVATQLLECNVGFPKYNYALRVAGGGRAEIVYSSICNSSVMVAQIALSPVYFASATAINELATTLHVLGQHSSESILLAYKRSFLDVTCARNKVVLSGQQNVIYLYSIFPKFRNNQSLNNAFNDTEITFLQAFSNGYSYCSSLPLAINAPNPLFISNEQHYLRLKSQRQRSPNNTYILRYVSIDLIESGELYHPAQQINLSPIWIAGHTYQKSIYK